MRSLMDFPLYAATAVMAFTGKLETTYLYNPIPTFEGLIHARQCRDVFIIWHFTMELFVMIIKLHYFV